MSRPTYNVRGYGSMIADRVRMDAFAGALERVVRPGSVVLDVGAGTGIMALLACRLGARRVFAVEADDVLQTARLAARANGMEDRIEFIQGLSTEVELPERADVIVSDLRGVLPLAWPNIPSVADFRERLLKPGGVLVPGVDTLRAALVEAEKEYATITDAWTEHSRGLDLSALRDTALNDWAKERFTPRQLVTEPRTWAVLDYRTVHDPGVRGTLRWTVEQTRTAHGLAVWFDTELAEGIGYTTGPGGPETVYGTAFFPFSRPLALRPGDEAAVDLQARVAGDEYVWAWQTRVEHADGSRTEFRQSTFLGRPLTPKTLRRHAHDFVPVLGRQGEVERTVLSMMDGRATLGEIAEELCRRFPERFPDWERALAHAGRLSENYAG